MCRYPPSAELKIVTRAQSSFETHPCGLRGNGPRRCGRLISQAGQGCRMPGCFGPMTPLAA